MDLKLPVKQETICRNRKLYIKALNIECGLPQGSILGPLLYLLYVNDICKASEGNILSFADDTSLYMSDHNMEIIRESKQCNEKTI